ncbi:GDP-L-fucose synthase family protein [Methylobacterium sp. CM6244]
MANTNRILVTGAGGLMGTALIDELSQNSGKTVIGVNSDDADLTDFEATCRLLKKTSPDIVYHLAARVAGIMGNMKAQGQAYFDNIRINTNVIEASRLAGVAKVVGMGSTAVYSDVVPLPMREESVWFGAPHSSEAGYAHAKRAMLAQMEAYRDQYGMDFAFCISTNLFGPNDKFDEKNGHVLPSLISKFHRAVKEQKNITIWGTGTPERDFLYTKDAARAMRLIGENFSGAINMASGNAISILETANLLKRISGLEEALDWDRSKPDGQKLRSYDTSKLQSLGFSPKYDLESGLTETYNWYSENVDRARR